MNRRFRRPLEEAYAVSKQFILHIIRLAPPSDILVFKIDTKFRLPLDHFGIASVNECGKSLNGWVGKEVIY